MRRTSREGLQRWVALTLAAAVGAASMNPAYASRKTEAQNAKQEAQNDLNSVRNDINNITSRQKSLQKEIDALDSELVSLLLNMDILSDELTDKEAEIKQANKDLKVARNKEETQYDRMKKRIRYMYERGDDSILEVLLGATSMRDLLNRISYSTEIYNYDRNQLDEYKETKQQVKAIKTQLLEEQAEMEEMQANYESQERELNDMVAKKQLTMSDFNSQLSEARQLAAAYKETIDQQNKIIRDEERKEQEAAEAAARAEAEARARAEAEAQAAAEAAAAARAAQAQAEAEARAQAAAQAAQAAQQSSGSSGSGSSGSPAVSPSGATGSDVIAYASQFIGNPYVWGGTSLTNGADCSGFVMSVYAHFGYSLPHSSAAMASCGIGVSYSEAQPGDLICYSGHVALYIGGGMILGAQSSATGITTQTATYRTIIAVRRIIY